MAMPFVGIDRLDDVIWDDPLRLNGFCVEHGDRFKPGAVIRMEGSQELMRVKSSSGRWVHVERGYAGTRPEALQARQTVHILGRAEEAGGQHRENV
jgi:hypothetical protein